MDGVVQPAVALRQQRDDDDLARDGDERQPRGAEAHVGERAQAPAREGHAWPGTARGRRR